MGAQTNADRHCEQKRKELREREAIYFYLVNK